MLKKIIIPLIIAIAFIFVLQLVFPASHTVYIPALKPTSNVTAPTLENLKLALQIIYYTIGILLGILALLGISLYRCDKKQLSYIRNLGIKNRDRLEH